MYSEIFEKYDGTGKQLDNAKYFQGECSTSYDLTGDDILSFRLGYTDEDVAASPGYPWIIMKLKSGKIITFVINDIVQEKSNVE